MSLGNYVYERGKYVGKGENPLDKWDEKRFIDMLYFELSEMLFFDYELLKGEHDFEARIRRCLRLLSRLRERMI